MEKNFQVMCPVSHVSKEYMGLLAVNSLRTMLNTCQCLQVAAPKQDAAATGAEVLHNVHERCYVEIRRI